MRTSTRGVWKAQFVENARGAEGARQLAVDTSEDTVIGTVEAEMAEISRDLTARRAEGAGRLANTMMVDESETVKAEGAEISGALTARKAMEASELAGDTLICVMIV